MICIVVRPRWAIASFVGVFGVLTFKSGAEVLFFDGPFEMRTVAAMILRSLIWITVFVGLSKKMTGHSDDIPASGDHVNARGGAPDSK